MAERFYDGNSNPRSLTSVPTEEEQATYEAFLVEAQKELDAINKVCGVFNSAGWQLVRATLYEDVNAAVQAICSDQVNTMEGVAFIRGQIRAYQRLMSLGDEATKRKDMLVDTLKKAKEQVEA